jgi:hypothetical protein
MAESHRLDMSPDSAQVQIQVLARQISGLHLIVAGFVKAIMASVQ